MNNTFQEVKPGLSSFAENPVEGGATIRKLINTALNIVPVEHRSKTPVTLKATAGRSFVKVRKSCLYQKKSLDRLINRIRDL